MKHIILIMSIVTFLAFGCSTSRGLLFRDVVEDDKPENASPEVEPGEKQDAPRDKPPEETGEDEQGVYVTSYPDDAEVYINGELQGYTPLKIEDLETGTYKVELSMEGYEPERVWVTIDEDSYVELDFELSLITGFIELLPADHDIELYIDGDPVHPGRQELPVGEHTVHARKFGFEDYSATVLIEEDRTARVDITLEKAVFALRDINVSREILNPDNPGNLGKSSISFEVTTFGTGTLTLENETGQTVLDHTFPDFTTWKHEITWDGSDNLGNPLPDGTYRVTVSGTSSDGSVQDTVVSQITIDREAVIRFRLLLSGVSGLLYAPSPEVLPVGVIQFSSLILGHFENTGTAVLARFPVQLSLRLSFFPRVEFDVQGTAFIQTSETKPYSIGGAVKYLFLQTGNRFRVSGGLTGKLTYLAGETNDTVSNYSGFHLGFPWMLSLGPVSLILHPEFSLWFSRIAYPFESPETEAVVFPGGYGRAGLLLDFGTIWGGISTALRTLPFTEGFKLHLPFLAAGELHLLIPNTQFVISALASLEYATVESWYIMGGIGLGFLN